MPGNGNIFRNIFNSRAVPSSDAPQEHALNVLRERPWNLEIASQENIHTQQSNREQPEASLATTEPTSDKTVSKLEQRLDSFEQEIQQINGIINFDRTSLPDLRPAERERLDTIQVGMQGFAASHTDVFVKIHEFYKEEMKPLQSSMRNYESELNKLHEKESNATTDEEKSQVEAKIHRLMQSFAKVEQKQTENIAWLQNLRAIVGHDRSSFVTYGSEGMREDNYPIDQVMLSGDLNRRCDIVDNDLSRLQQVKAIYTEQIKLSQDIISSLQAGHQRATAHIKELETKVLQAGNELKYSHNQYRDAIARENLHSVSPNEGERFASEKKREWEDKRQELDILTSELKQLREDKGELKSSLHMQEKKYQALGEAFYPVANAIALGKDVTDNIARLQQEMPGLANDSRLTKINETQRKFYAQQLRDLNKSAPKQLEIAKAGLRDIAHIEHFRPKNPEAVALYNAKVREDYKKRYRTQITYIRKRDGITSWAVRTYAGDSKVPCSVSEIEPEVGLFRAALHFKTRPKFNLSNLYQFQFRSKGDGFFDDEVRVEGTKPLHASKVHYNQIEDFKEYIKNLEIPKESELYGYSIPEFNLKQFEENNVVNPQSRKIMKIFLPRRLDSKRFEDGSAGLYASAQRKTSKGIWFVGYHYSKRPSAVEISRKSFFDKNDKKISSEYFASTYFSDK